MAGVGHVRWRPNDDRPFSFDADTASRRTRLAGAARLAGGPRNLCQDAVARTKTRKGEKQSWRRRKMGVRRSARMSRRDGGLFCKRASALQSRRWRSGNDLLLANGAWRQNGRSFTIVWKR